MSNWRPRKLKPVHLAVLRLYFQGLSNDDIVSELASRGVAISPSTVSSIINSQDAEEILNKMTSHTLDTVQDIKSDVQAVVPLVLEEKIRLALSAKDERVRSTSCMDIIAIAGHLPVRQLHVEHVIEDPDKWKGASEEDIRQEILSSLVQRDDGETIH